MHPLEFLQSSQLPFSDEQAIHFNMEELSSIISSRSKIYIRADKLNRWSVPLAIISLLTTIIFGITSITQTIDYDKIAKVISEKVVKQQLDSKK